LLFKTCGGAAHGGTAAAWASAERQFLKPREMEDFDTYHSRFLLRWNIST
jgi:hypothetical protein